MAAERYLIVNGDDFGLSAGVNRGIVTAHENGILTSASLMVRWPAASEAAGYARSNKVLSVGLHVDLGEWEWLDGMWRQRYDVVRTDDSGEVCDELMRQLTLFHRLVGADPTHLDSHQHVHRREPTRSALTELARSLGVPLRHGPPGFYYNGAFYGQTGRGGELEDGVTVDALNRILKSLPPGVTELGCHPGYGDDLVSTYRLERSEEVRVLCDSRVRDVVDNEEIHLCSFREAMQIYGRGSTLRV